MTGSPGKQATDEGALQTSRVLPFRAADIFEAFARPESLAQWWGPDGFTNTFEAFEFRPGGTWRFVMHGPQGTHHPNESRFVEIVAAARVVIRHVSNPRYLLTIALAEQQDGSTTVTWTQRFDEAVLATRLQHIVVPANEQNLDRLTAVLALRQAGAG